MLSFKRKSNAVFIDFPEKIIKGQKIVFRVNYEGAPREAVNPPWDGGFSWDYDKNKNFGLEFHVKVLVLAHGGHARSSIR